MNIAALSHAPHASPLTGAPLQAGEGRLTSADGAEAYPVTAGIANFLRYPAAEDAGTVERLERLNEAAVRLGWRAGLESIYGSDDGFMRYVTDPTRTSFLDLLPLRRDMRALEIGPGLAQITAALAPRVRTLDALEIVPGQARFAAERCRQSGLDNVRVAIGGDDCRLPYPDESFDIVVLNLVFEWCAQRCPGESFEDVQKRLLSSMNRVLRPGGVLYLATKNRFALDYLTGHADEHCYHLRFGNALPRRLRDYLLRRRGHPAPGGVLHSHNALQRMLREAGFGRSESYWAAPEMRYPQIYVRTDAASVRQARREPGFLQGHRRASRMLMRMTPSAWVRHVTPGLAFIATKAGGPSA